MIRFDDIAGSYDHRHNDLAKFIRTWFRPDDDIVLGAFPAPNRQHEHRDKSFMATTASQLAQGSTDVFEVAETLQRDTYLRITPIRDPDMVTGERIGSGNTMTPLGMWADLDVKPESFGSQLEVTTWLDTLPIKPTMIIRNGESGGMHAYWRVQDADLDRMTGEHMKMWWAYLQSMTPTQSNGERVMIDRLVDMTRLARLPGMIYWPKSAEAKLGTVALAGGTFEQIPLDSVEQLSAGAYKADKDATTRTATQARRVDREFGRGFASPLEKFFAEERINALSWDQILGPFGWEMLRENSDGSRQWSRPGIRRKSAVTDYTDPKTGQVSDVMSLLSGSDESGLLDLKEAGIPLTKFRVLSRIRYADNMRELVNEIHNPKHLTGGSL